MTLSKRAKDITGQSFGSWTVIEHAGYSSGKARIALWKCRCVCGEEAVVYGTALRGGHSTCCSECVKGKISKSRTTHGMTDSPTWLSWKSMQNRCTCETSPDYPTYGGRGIKVCARWDSFENFLADMGERPRGKTLDRKDSNGNYEPGNCQWSTPKRQANNRSNNTFVEFKGERLTYSELGERLGMDRRRVRYYLAVKGMTPAGLAEMVKKSGGQSTVSGDNLK